MRVVATVRVPFPQLISSSNSSSSSSGELMELAEAMASMVRKVTKVIQVGIPMAGAKEHGTGRVDTMDHGTIKMPDVTFDFEQR